MPNSFSGTKIFHSGFGITLIAFIQVPKEALDECLLNQ